MSSALEIHNTFLRRTLADCGGYEVKTEGDSFMVAFGSAIQAVRWCLAAQEGLAAVQWPPEILAHEAAREEAKPDGERLFSGLRLRMGVHIGRPECRPDPVTGRMDYFGPMVNRAARVAAAAHGGQVVVTGWVWQEIEAQLALLGSPHTMDLGEYRLKGLESAEQVIQIIQIMPKSLAGRRFPPLRTAEVRKTNLTAAPTRFVGRKPDLQRLHEYFAGGERLVTILGPGGTGKTRLASQYGLLQLDHFSHDGGGGVWFCDLSEATGVDGVFTAVAKALNVSIAAGRSPSETAYQLGQALAGRGRVLLILDNFEQVVESARATVGRWLELSPDAQFLISSRERLRLPGEMTHALGPLSLPKEDAEFAASEAVQLFVDRVRAVRQDYALTADEAPAVVAIVRHLDGIPLAIELAAARMGVLTPAKLLQRLPRRFEVLGGGDRDAASRQSTLRGAIDWSWNLLQPWEKSALAQCSVFKGGFMMEAAEAIIDLGEFPGPPWVLDVIQALRDKSLLRSFEPAGLPGELRFGLYESIAEYAAEKLAEAGRSEAALHRHAEYYVQMGSEIGGKIEGPDGIKVMRFLALESENLMAIHKRALVGSTLNAERVSQALRAVLAIDPVLSMRGPFDAHLSILDSARGMMNVPGVDPVLKARLLESRGRARRARGRLTDALADFENALEISKEVGNRSIEGMVLYDLGTLYRDLGQIDKAQPYLERALADQKAAGDRGMEGTVTGYVAIVAQDQGRLDEAASLYAEALRIHREVGNRRLEGITLGNLGHLHMEKGVRREARESFDLALSILREVGDRRFEGIVIGNLGVLEFDEGNHETAWHHLERALAIHREVGSRRFESIVLRDMGTVHLDRGGAEEAWELFQLALAIQREIGDRRLEAITLGHLGTAEAELSHIERSREAFEGAEKLAEAGHDESLKDLLHLERGHLDCALSRQAASEGDAAAAKAFRQTAENKIQAVMARGGPDLRFAVRILRRSLTAE